MTACGFLVDHHLGVTAVVGPRILDDQQHALFTRTFFAGSLRMPVPVALPVAHRIVYDGIRRAINERTKVRIKGVVEKDLLESPEIDVSHLEIVK